MIFNFFFSHPQWVVLKVCRANVLQGGLIFRKVHPCQESSSECFSLLRNVSPFRIPWKSFQTQSNILFCSIIDLMLIITILFFLIFLTYVLPIFKYWNITTPSGSQTLILAWIHYFGGISVHTCLCWITSSLKAEKLFCSSFTPNIWLTHCPSVTEHWLGPTCLREVPTPVTKTLPT